MEKDLIFFGEGGITDTKANRIADLAKLSYLNEETELSSLSFIDESVETINGENKKDIAYGASDLSLIESRIQRVGDLKSLCAWLREAVAAHQRLLSEIERFSFQEYVKRNNIELGNQPRMEDVLTEDDVIASFDIKKRNRYYSLEAQAATIGQLIHKNCAIDKSRKTYYEKLSHPRHMIPNGADTLIYSYKPSVPKEVVENLFYALQQKHADYQSELNSIKSEIKSRITNDSIEKKQRFEVAVKEYNNRESEVFNEYSSWKASESKRIASLKIIIPNALKDIFDKVASTGKKEQSQESKRLVGGHEQS